MSSFHSKIMIFIPINFNYSSSSLLWFPLDFSSSIFCILTSLFANDSLLGFVCLRCNLFTVSLLSLIASRFTSNWTGSHLLLCLEAPLFSRYTAFPGVAVISLLFAWKLTRMRKQFFDLLLYFRSHFYSLAFVIILIQCSIFSLFFNNLIKSFWKKCCDNCVKMCSLWKWSLRKVRKIQF